jgi:glycosyltransferase involved in cell wall biosynthesis
MLSVVLITLNESRNIERAIRSLAGLTDDIVVVDSGSEDDTVVLSQQLGARVFVKDWEGYSRNKNFGISQARHPWILSLDADEALSPELRQSILESFATMPSAGTVFAFNRLTNYCGSWIRHSGWYPDRKIRIWHRDTGRWEGAIHEHIVFKNDPEVIRLKGDLLHYSFYTREEHLRQIEHFTTLMAEDLHRSGKKASVLKVWSAPAIRLLRDFVMKRGFLDGKPGWHVCSGSAYAAYLKYAKLRALNANPARR